MKADSAFRSLKRRSGVANSRVQISQTGMAGCCKCPLIPARSAEIRILKHCTPEPVVQPLDFVSFGVDLSAMIVFPGNDISEKVIVPSAAQLSSSTAGVVGLQHVVQGLAFRDIMDT